MNCGKLADYYLEFAKPKEGTGFMSNFIGDPTRVYSKSNYFVGYVSGFRSGDRWRDFDVPEQVTDGQLAHVVGKWLRAHPEHWHHPMRNCVYQALIETWPKS